MVSRRHKVVIVGAGFGGLAAARALADQPVDVVIVDARNHHTFQPLLYQVATAGLDGDDICYATRGIFHRQRNATVLLGEVTGANLDQRTLTLADGASLEYDHLILACGAVTNSFGVPGVDEHAFGLKSLSDAMAIRTHVLRKFEEADAHPDRLDDGLLTVAIAGGGPTGVELAGGMVELFTNVLRRDFPRLDVGRARVVLIEATDRLLGTFSPGLGDNALRTLERRGVEVLIKSAVERVDPQSVRLADGSVIPCHTMIWAAGVKAHPIALALGVETARGGRIVVDRQLRVPNHPEVFVIGDLGASLDAEGQILPQVAPVAIQGAAHAVAMIDADLHHETGSDFTYKDKGSMATIGRHDAVAELPNGLRLRGFPGWVAWLGLHLLMLIGFRNRANVLVNWAWNYLTYDRGSRIISD